MRDEVVDFITMLSNKTGLPVRHLLGWAGIAPAKFDRWRERYGKANEHNGRCPIRSQLEPVKAVARMVKRHLDGIINGIVHGVTNARTEGMNSIIQWLRIPAEGDRRFRSKAISDSGGSRSPVPEGDRPL